jgi:protein TonB
MPTLLGDATRITEDLEAGRRGQTPVPGAPAPDSGEGQGRAAPVAYRRDRSTLRARLTDGAEVYQPSRERTGRRASSPQALRREAVVGIGDASRDREPGAAAPPPEPAVVAADGEGSEAPAAEAAATAGAASPSAGKHLTKGEGPLDAEQGRRAFDVEQEGPARETVALRAASDAPRPGLVDLAAPSAPGPQPGIAGRGPAATPGVVAQAVTGAAPAVTGTPGAPGGTRDDAATLERPYSREHLEIRQRVARQFRFPKRLALMLEQGETVLRFLVRTDGRISGAVSIIKSAGFAEFDREAVGMVERAAPFPTMHRPLLVTMPIAFENPLVR